VVISAALNHQTAREPEQFTPANLARLLKSHSGVAIYSQTTEIDFHFSI
jgi:hypothetical protein